MSVSHAECPDIRNISCSSHAPETFRVDTSGPSTNNFYIPRLERILRFVRDVVMREIKNRVLFLSLAVFVSLLAVVQPMRPILAAELSDTPMAANLHQELTRHCIEEVSSDQVEEPVTQLSFSGAEKADAKPARPDFSRENSLVPVWPCQPVHRKLLPPSPKDG